MNSRLLQTALAFTAGMAVSALARRLWRPKSLKISRADQDVTVLTTSTLESVDAAGLVQENGAGAIATFAGTTRDHFEGKQVVKLEYEAYEPLALKELQRLCSTIRQRWTVRRIAVVHRLGVVPVGEMSVVIAVSSEHRRQALEAVQFAIDELKSRVPIWKKEVYSDGATWKQNAEFDAGRIAHKT